MISDNEQISLQKSREKKQENEDIKYYKQFGDIFHNKGKCSICGNVIGEQYKKDKFVEVYLNFYQSEHSTLNNYPKQINNKRAFICQKCYENRFSII